MLKLIELWSKDNLVLRELGGSLAPDRSSGCINKIHFNECTCKHSTYIHAHISYSYDHVTF